MSRVIVAVDMGATWTRIGYYTRDGRELSFQKLPTPRIADGARVASWLAEAILSSAPAGSLWSAGIAVFGPIDYTRGAVVNPPNHPARIIPLRSTIERALNVPVLLVNDAVASAWSELVLSRSQGENVQDLVSVTLGTGVGVGVVVGGRLLLGRRGDSHEAGHIVLDYSSPLTCGCGGQGHWEALARAYRSDPARLSRIVAAGLGSLVSCYDPEVIVLSGGLVEAGLIDVGAVERMLAEYSFSRRKPLVRRHRLGGKGNLYGAYLLANKPVEELLRLNGW